MRFQVLFFLVVLGCLYLTMAQGSYDDCCLKYSSEVRQRVKRMVVSYAFQTPDGGCNIPAIVFTLKKNRHFCGDPQQHWVQELIRRVNKKNEKNKFISASLSQKKRYQGPK